jgi:hypothetical protein
MAHYRAALMPTKSTVEAQIASLCGHIASRKKNRKGDCFSRQRRDIDVIKIAIRLHPNLFNGYIDYDQFSILLGREKVEIWLRFS